MDLARNLLLSAHTLFSIGMFQQAAALAMSSQTTASTAKVPSDYLRAGQLITTAESLKNQTANLSSPESKVLVAEANVQLERAREAFEAENFTFTIVTAQVAIDLFNRAKQIDLSQTILMWVSNLALVVPVMILAYALRYQLKRE